MPKAKRMILKEEENIKKHEKNMKKIEEKQRNQDAKVKKPGKFSNIFVKYF